MLQSTHPPFSTLLIDHAVSILATADRRFGFSAAFLFSEPDLALHTILEARSLLGAPCVGKQARESSLTAVLRLFAA